MEQTATMVAADNVELACCFIQKTAIEKALIEIDKRLAAVSVDDDLSGWLWCTLWEMRLEIA